MPFQFDSERTSQIAQDALQRIRALEIPLDPPAFELWFTYCAGINRGLNDAVNTLLGTNPKPAAADLRVLYDCHISPKRFVDQVHTLGKTLRERTSELIDTIEEVSEANEEYGAEVAIAARELAQDQHGQGLQSTVSALLRSTEDVQRTNMLLQNQLSASIEQVRQLQGRLESVQQESMIDPLTGVGNRRQFDTSLVSMIEQSKSQGSPISLLLVDVDNFKQINDKLGHPVGDDVLRLISSLIKRSCRTEDLICRYGGDEFAVILPATPIEGAVAAAEHICAHVHEKEMLRRSTREVIGRFSVSIGAAQCRAGDSSASLIEQADRWLYVAKQRGRNCVGAEGANNSRADLTKTHEKFVWRAVYECGDSVIDREHRELFRLANTIFSLTSTPKTDSAEFGKLLDGLLAHIAKHFADEEALLAEKQYRKLSWHRSAHSQLLADAEQLKAAIAVGEKSLDELRDFIAHEIIAQHLLKADREFFSLFRAEPSPSLGHQNSAA